MLKPLQGELSPREQSLSFGASPPSSADESQEPSPLSIHLTTILDCIIIVLLAGFVLFWKLDSGSLTPNDETQHVLVTQTMLSQGKWWYLSTGNRPYYGKPPFKMWLSTIPVTLFGQSNLTFRSLDAILGIGTCLLVYYFARRVFGSRSVGLIATVLLLGCKGFVTYHVARNAVQDSMLVFLFTLAVILSWELITRLSPSHRAHLPQPPGSQSRWPLAVGIGLVIGVAAMVKSIAALVVFPLIALYVAISGDALRIVRGGFLPGIAAIVIALAIPAPYFASRCAQHDEMCHGVFAGDSINRALQQQHVKINYVATIMEERLGIPPEILVVGVMLGLFCGFRYRDKRYLFVTVWTLGVVLLLTVLKGRYPWYIAPTYPPMALLGALAFEHTIKWFKRSHGARQTFAGLCFVAGMGFAGSHLERIWNEINVPREEIPINQLVRAMNRSGHTHPGLTALAYRAGGFSMREKVYWNMLRKPAVSMERRSDLIRALGRENVSFVIIPAKSINAVGAAREPESYLYLPGQHRDSQWLVALSYLPGSETDGFAPVTQRLRPLDDSSRYLFGWRPPSPIEGEHVRTSMGPTSAFLFRGDAAHRRVGAEVEIEAALPTNWAKGTAVEITASLNGTEIGKRALVPHDFSKLKYFSPADLWQLGNNVIQLRLERVPLPSDAEFTLYHHPFIQALLRTRLAQRLGGSALRGTKPLAAIRSLAMPSALATESGTLPVIGPLESVIILRQASVKVALAAQAA